MKILYKNLIDDVTATMTFSSEVATLPGTNVLDDQRGKVWETTGCASEWVKLVFPGNKYFNAIALAGFNLSASATVTLQANMSDDWTSPAVEEEFEVWEPVIGFDEGLYGEHGYGGYLTDDEMPKYTTMVRFLAAAYAYPYIRLLIEDLDNEDGYLDIGRVFIGEAYEPYGYHDWDWKLIAVDPSVVTKSEGGQAYKDIKSPFSLVKLKLQNLTDEEAYYRFIRIMQDYGVHANIFICMDPSSAQGRLFTGVYGFFQGSQLPLGNCHVNRWQTNFTFEEAV
ncbi:MAG TPA: hypothetical protein PKM59_02000 [Thermodesulfobacteriota bacterium]|nr:hypothetical protein [Thermodesulfobacteriota bacterium]HNU70586.1 hypothetical protein [Thermodesulfobacteriota bacterium]